MPTPEQSHSADAQRYVPPPENLPVENVDDAQRDAGSTTQSRGPLVGIFDRISQNIRDTASAVREGLYNTPVVNTIVGKLEIAYNQMFMNGHEQTARGLKGDIDALDAKIRTLEASKEKVRTLAGELSQNLDPALTISGGVENSTVVLKLRDIDEQISQLMLKKGIIQTKFDTYQGKVENYTQKRDAVAHKLIEYFDQRIDPIEQEINSLSDQKKELVLVRTGIEITHRGLLDGIARAETEMQQIMLQRRAQGVSEVEIEKLLAEKKDFITRSRIQIRKNEQEYTRRIKVIEAKILVAHQRANPYRDNREQFVAITRKRPLYSMSKRTKGVPHGDVQAYTRPEKQEKKDPLHLMLEGWNGYIQAHEENGLEPIDPEVLFDVIKVVQSDTPVTWSEFTQIVENYYMIQGIELPVIKDVLKKFDIV